MKIDYKEKIIQMGSPIFRRTLHVSLGLSVGIGFMLFLSFFSFHKSDPTTNSLTLPLEMASDKKDKVTIYSNLATNPPIASVKQETAVVAEKTSDTWYTIKVREKDTLSKIFSRLNIATKGIHDIMISSPAAKHLASLQPGQTLKLCMDKNQQINGITLDIAAGNSLHISRKEKGFQVEHKITPLEKKLAFGKGAIQDSLFSSGKRAGLDYKILTQMVDIFGWSIDFALDLQPDDTFRVLYEEKCLDGEKIQTGNILAAEIVNSGKKHQAIRYNKAGVSGYFTPDGYGMHQAFLRTPVNFTRISSHFGNRRHPILHHLRHHKGVDYSAPHGTQVQATADGKVIFMGIRGGYGKVIELQHGARYSTLYAHLSRFPKGLRQGMEVKQGQVIGFVGKTGLATGDHLHYEFRIDGIHRDPLTVTLPKRNPIPENHKRHFIAYAKEMLRLLDLHENKINVAQIDEHSAKH